MLRVGGTEILAAVAYLSSKQTSLVLILVFALFPAIFLWWVVNVVQKYDDNSDIFVESVTDYKKVFNSQADWIDEDKFFEIAMLTDMKDRIKLDDYIVFDEQLLLLRQRDRRIAMLSFNDERVCAGIIKAFEELNQQTYSNPNATFELIQ